jgi:hypothetical protein
MYFGCVAMLLVWSGLVFVAVRDQAFLAYFAYVATFGVYMTVNTGFAFQYLWPDSPRWANVCLIMLLNFALLTALQFSTTILRARDYTPRMFRVARLLQVLAALGIALSPFVAYSTLIRPVTFLILIAVIFMITLGIVSLLSGSRPARFYVIAWGAFLLWIGDLPAQELRRGAAHLHEPAQLAGGRAGRDDPAVDDAQSSHERAQAPEPHRSAHAARQPPPVRRPAARRICDGATGEAAPVLLMLDIDNFKLYNDQHGHSLGDEAIKLVGSALRRHARKPVLACRYGGDEFCMVLPARTRRPRRPLPSGCAPTWKRRAATRWASPSAWVTPRRTRATSRHTKSCSMQRTPPCIRPRRPAGIACPISVDAASKTRRAAPAAGAVEGPGFPSGSRRPAPARSGAG